MILLTLTAVMPCFVASLPTEFSSSAPISGSTPLHAPASDSVETLVLRGRRQLTTGELEQAEASFLEAVELEDSVRTRPWLIRSWIEAGRVEQALSATQTLEQSQAPSDVVAYLYGMSFRALALREVAEGGSSAGLFFNDALGYLSEAERADMGRFPDLHFALAETAWHTGDLQLAAVQIRRALEQGPADAPAHLLDGRIALARYQSSAELDPEAAAAELERASQALKHAITALGSPKTSAQRWALAETWIQRGYVALFAEDLAASAVAFGQAASWAPEAIDFNYWNTTLGKDVFVAQIDTALAAKSRAREREETALLNWWQGFGHYQKNKRADFALAEVSFRQAVELHPEFVASWYYMAKAQYAQQKQAEALDALRQYAAVDRKGLIGSLQAESSLDAYMLEGLVGWCAQGGGQGSRPDNEGAAFLTELLTEVQPQVARHWSNLGLFLRDQGTDRLRNTPKEERISAQIMKPFERSLAAYERALELEPDNPVFLNDTALILHYYLTREDERAAALYRQADEAARARLAAEGQAGESLSASQREVLETVLTDAANNLLKLEDRARLRAQREAEERAGSSSGGSTPPQGQESSGS